MLIYSHDIDIKNEDIATSLNHDSNNVLEAFIQIFAKQLFQELRKGIYKKYITHQDNLPVLKGKYKINENLKYNLIKNKIYCEFDEFSEDNALNQFFLYSVKTLSRYAKDKKQLNMCELALCDVEYRQLDMRNIEIYFDRLNKRFEGAYDLAMLLLQKSIPMFDDGKKSFAFLFDMNALFEKFIGNIYKSIDSSTLLQNEKNFGNLKLKPDIITSSQIIDCKYKIVKNKEELNTQDKYQMYVYGANFDLKDTMLLYPKHNHPDIDKNLKLGKDDKMVKLKMRSIDLNFCSGGYEKYIKVIKARIQKLWDK